MVLQEGHNLEDASKVFYAHCSNHKHGRGSIPVHPASEVLTEKALKEVLQASSNASSTRVTFMRGRARLMSTSFIKSIFGEAFLATLTFTPNVA